MTKYVYLFLVSLLLLAACQRDMPPNPGIPGGGPIGKVTEVFEGYSVTTALVVNPNVINLVVGTDTEKSVEASVTSEDYVYKKGYVLDVVNNAWVEFTFDQPTIALSNWIAGTASTNLVVKLTDLNMNLDGVNTLYVLAYGCKRNEDLTWDCHDFKWMIKDFQAILSEAGTATEGAQIISLLQGGVPGSVLINGQPLSYELMSVAQDLSSCSIKMALLNGDTATINVGDVLVDEAIETKVLEAHIDDGNIGQCIISVTQLSQQTILAPETPTCSDSDVTEGFPDGMNYGVQGTASGFETDGVTQGEMTDSCNGDLLTEWSCPSIAAWPGAIASSDYICPNGCSDGACLLVPFCSDTDNSMNYEFQKPPVGGEDIYVKGIIPDMTDYCVNINLGEQVASCTSTESCGVKEGYCSPTTGSNSLVLVCANGCNDGACLITAPAEAAAPAAEEVVPAGTGALEKK